MCLRVMKEKPMKLLFTNESLRRKIASDLDDEPTAGGEALADFGADAAIDAAIDAAMKEAAPRRED